MHAIVLSPVLLASSNFLQEVDTIAICEPFCTEPCRALNGDTAYECGACQGRQYKCKGQRKKLQPNVQARTPFSPVAITEALGRTASEHCIELAQRGMCDTKMTGDASVRAAMLQILRLCLSST